VIISASYKTDIPAFFGEWFRNRLAAGFCRMVNPFNANHHYKVSLAQGDVDGFIFWTKNVGPFLPVLDGVAERGTPFIVQYTINGYPRALESRVVNANRSVEHMHELAARHGPKVPVWRYDTIIFSTLTDADFHRRNFERLAKNLEGSTDEVVVSFMQLYKKTERNLNAAGSEHGFEWRDPPSEEKLELLRDLSAMARSFSMTLTMCSQPEFLLPEVGEARCVDAKRLVDVGGRDFRAKLGGGRKECGCFTSKDIGDYDTCPHGCIYCYAVRDRKLALTRFREHDPEGEYLFPRAAPTPVEPRKQLSLLPEE
jgi:hypothetical protein